MTVSDVEAEVLLLNLENIKKMPIPRSLLEDFYNMWQRFGPQAARDFMIPSLWKGFIPKPSEAL